MLKLISLLLVNQVTLIGGQVLLKIALDRVPSLSWTWSWIWHNVILNPILILAIVLFTGGNLIWVYMLKLYPLSTAYPLTSIGFVFSMLSGWLILKETITPLQWIGVVLVMVGCYLIASHSGVAQ